jgi:putative endonuclease
MGQSFHVYVLRSAVTGRSYVGSTGDLNDRLRRHNDGRSKATKHGVPWELIHSEEFATKSQAVQRELFLKSGKGRDELARLEDGRLTRAVAAATGR